MRTGAVLSAVHARVYRGVARAEHRAPVDEENVRHMAPAAGWVTGGGGAEEQTERAKLNEGLGRQALKRPGSAVPAGFASRFALDHHAQRPVISSRRDEVSQERG